MNSKATVILHRYELGKLLGQGTFAKVYHAKNIQTGASVAIKIIDKEKILKVGLIKQIKHEISVMRLIRHQNIVELYEVMATKTKIYFVMEYARGGELFNKIAKGKLKEDVARKYFQQLISALDYCHCRGVCHRDLKPENLLLDENDNVKVSDFGLSTLVASSHKDGLLNTTCGTPAYVAPEVMNKNGYDGVKSDIWSCGVILFVLLAGYLPFRDSNLIDMYRKIVKGHFKIPNWFAPEVRKLLSKILDPNPNTRITIAKIMANPWFRKGLDPKPVEIDIQGKELVPLDSDALLGATEDPGVIVGSKQELARPSNLNAFDIISYSTGFDLSGLFEETNRKKEARFLSNKPASTIISMLEEIAKRLKLKLRKKEGGKLKLEVSEHVRKGALGMDVEIFEVTPFIHVVEVKKSNGETIEYQKVMNQDIKPALRDIVWTWQGEEQQQRQEEDKEVHPSNVKLQVDSPMES